ncbi:MAG TPA: SURF1 family protein [Candidatus Corynebacterium avicola]|uniref:SURF1-like protein n=1 Tax=Candidatus Corynebacterium avicola TaxID=2838527 RepID=A0A9D1RRH3_9CORY|nr:SURF1 family protein [Candidatus Corynebacterium avicola]
MSTPSATPATSRAPRSGAGTDRRRGWRSFLTPGWVITAVVAVAFSYFAFTVLAPWQLGKNKDTQDFQHRLEAALEKDPVPAEDVLPADGSSAGVEKEWTRVELQGRFLPGDEVLLRNRPVSSTQAYHALTPFQLSDGSTVMVNRGWLDASGDNGAGDVPEVSGEPTTVTGYVRMSEDAPSNSPITEEGRLQVYGMSTEAVGDTVDLDLAADYVQLDEESVEATDISGRLSEIPLPDLDSGPYLSYGLQWIAFGVMVPAGLAYFVWAEIRERRRRREELAAADAAAAEDTTDAQDEPAAAGERPVEAAPAASSASSRERKLQERYGSKRNSFHDKRNARDDERF